MKFDELQVVQTLIAFPKENIEIGEIGTIVACFMVPNEAYEVEFVYDNGSTKAVFAILPEHIENA